MSTEGWARIGAPRVSTRQIIQMAENLIKDYVWATQPSLDLLTINFDHVYENYVYPKYEIVLNEQYDLGYDEMGKKILGEFDYENNTVYIDKALNARNSRRAFTCWHEVGGHAILQGDWLRGEWARIRGLRHLTTTDDAIDGRTESLLEQQANRFAAHAAAPSWFLRYVVRRVFDITRPVRYIGPTRYCLSVNRRTLYRQVYNVDELCRFMAEHIQWRFGGLSLESLGYRIAEDGYVIYLTRSAPRLRRVAPTATPWTTSLRQSALAESVF